MDKVKFYTHYDRPECDCEYYEPGTSLTAPDQVEPIQVTVKRCLRGEILQQAKDVYYENDGSKSVDEMLDNVDRTSSPGFDLADVSSLVESAKADQTASTEAVAEPKEEEKASESETQSNDSTNQSNE